MNSCDYKSIKDSGVQLLEHGLQLQTVIPVTLPAEEYPFTKTDPSTGGRLVVKDKEGNPRPAYVGKNPSFWLADGKPKLTSNKNIIGRSEFVARIEAAESLGKPIGLAIIPSNDVVVIDFDRKNYQSDKVLEEEWMVLIDRMPELLKTRIERTPGGGIHIYVRPADRMESWRSHNGGLHCNFSTALGGEHRGEILAGVRVCVCAPTVSEIGRYELLNSDYAFSFVEVENLESIGIYPFKKTLQDAAQHRETGKELITTNQQMNPVKVPRLGDLISRKAKNLLAGGMPYGCGESAKEDRSLQLTGFAKELYSWCNILQQNELPWEDDRVDLLRLAIAELNIEDKADRVLEGIDSTLCNHSDPDWALRRYQVLSGSGANRWIGRGITAVSESSYYTLNREDCRDRLREAVAANQSPTELEILLGELREASEFHPQELQRLLTAVKLEEENRDALLEEASAIESDLKRHQARAPIRLEKLFEPALADALRKVTEHLPYCDHVVATTYLAGVSGLAKLGTTICGNPYTNYVTPANLFVATVGRSGQKKTPLEKLLIRKPAEELIREMAAENLRLMNNWRDQCKSCKRKDEKPQRPTPLHLQIQDYTGEALVALLHELDKRGLSVLVVRDELSGLFGAMNAYRSGKGADEQQLLELFDGHAFTSLRVSSGERSYDRCQVSIYGAIQPGVLKELIKGGDPSGKWARFMFSPLPGNTLPLPTIVSEEEIEVLGHANQFLKDCARWIYTMSPQCYQLDAEAIELFSTYEHQKQIQAQQVQLESQAALYGKSAGKVLRVSVLLHILQIVVRGEQGEMGVQTTTLEKAIELVDYLDSWAMSLHLQAANSGERGEYSSLMRRIHTLASKSRCAVPWTEMRKQMSSKEKHGISADLAEQAMRALMELGCGELSEGPRGGMQYQATKELPL